MKPVYSLLILIVLFSCKKKTEPIPSPSSYEKEIDTFIAAEMERQKIPGLSVAIIKDEQPILIKGYGFANLEHKVPVKHETIFQSGSIGKQFTATAIMLLVEDSKVKLEDPVNRYIQETPSSWNNITIQHLLSHTSGMGDYPSDFDFRKDYTEDDLLEIIKQTPLQFNPGENWGYSNLAYGLTGIIIRKITGQYYGDYITEKIFTPLGMKTANVISEADIVPNRAAGYELVEGKIKNQEWVSPSLNTTADGALYFSMLDMIAWDKALSGETLLRQNNLDTMWELIALNDGKKKPYGLGWFTDKKNNMQVVYHGGSWQGFKSFILRMPKEKFSVILFANLNQADETRITRGLTAIFYPEFALPVEIPIEDKHPEVTRLTKQTLWAITQNKVKEETFTKEAYPKLFPESMDRIHQTMNQLSLPIALIFSTQLIEYSEQGDTRKFRYMLNDIGLTLYCSLELTKENVISNFELSD